MSGEEKMLTENNIQEEMAVLAGWLAGRLAGGWWRPGTRRNGGGMEN